MPRHDIRPGRLVAGLSVLGAAAAYAGDAAGAWRTPWYTAFPVLSGGLWAAATVTWVHYRIRRRRSARSASSEKTDVPASTSGTQAIM